LLKQIRQISDGCLLYNPISDFVLSRFVFSGEGVMVTIMTEPKTQRCQKKTEILTFRELEVTTSLGLTRFLTLNLTCVTRHEAF
jgi:hypothetical protein